MGDGKEISTVMIGSLVGGAPGALLVLVAHELGPGHAQFTRNESTQ